MFYCIYLGCKTPHRKRQFSRKYMAIGLFSCIWIIYSLAITFFLFLRFFSKSEISPLLIFVLPGIVAAICFVLPPRYFTYAKIDEIEAKYQNTISFGMARVILIVILLSCPIASFLAAQYGTVKR